MSESHSATSPTAGSVAVHVPPLAWPEMAATEGGLGEAPEDFVVDELPLYSASGAGDHWYVRMRKRSQTTNDLLRAVARASGARESDLGVAGMKDRHAVTTQWVSVPASSPSPDTWELPEAFEVLETTRHENKLRTGHLKGNAFTVRLVGTHPESLERARDIASLIAAEGLPNYYGAQRFGRELANLGHALEWLRTPRDSRRRHRFNDKFYPSVLQSEVFNRYLTRRRRLGTRQLLTGELVRLEGTGSHFVVEQTEREQPRFDAGDLHLTGPLPGAKVRAAEAEAAALEALTVSELGLTLDDFRRLGRRAPGARRDLLVRPQGLRVQRPTAGTLTLHFELPAGSYATQLLREFTHGAWATPHPKGA